MIKINCIFLNQNFIRFFFWLIILFSSHNSYSQWHKFVGSIHDKETHKPVQFANIAVRNIPVGTCTNSYGDFVLNLPDSLIKGSLDISCIGYESRSYPIDSLTRIDTLLFLLAPKEYQLKDIVVVPGENDVQTILKKVISKIDNNYSGKKYFLEAFFRHRVFNLKENYRTVRLTEAAISIHENHKSEENKRVQIKEIRNSNNYAELSTSAGRRLLYKVLGGNQNPIYRAMIVKRAAQKNFLRKLSKHEHYSVSLKDISFFDGTLVYVIEFKQESWDFLLKKYYTTHTFRKFSYFINSNDFAIIKAEKIGISHNPQLKHLVKNDSITSHELIQYRRFDKNYYPSYVYFSGGIPDMVAKVGEKNFYWHEAELMVNEIATRRKDYDRIKARSRMDKSKTLWDLEYEYNPTFWENYNLLLDNPLNPAYKQDLEFEIPLEKQFKKETNAKVRN